MKVGLLDTSYGSDNDGDTIIVDAILNRFPSFRRGPRLPTHRHLKWTERRIAAQSDALVVTGTNILSSQMRPDRQWKLSTMTLKAISKKVVFLGVGWRQYQPDPDQLNTSLLNSLLHPDLPVSARDEYTNSKLKRIGIDSLNTGCPTTWGLPEVMGPIGYSSECVFTFTSYNPDRNHDPELISRLCAKYEMVHIWPQGSDDQKNVQKMNLPRNAHLLPRGIESLDDALVDRDYIGTRLHAGIRAAQLGRPSLVVAVDNRAVEIGRDTGFPVVQREAGITAFEERFAQLCEQNTRISINHADIAKWTKCFEKLLATSPPVHAGNECETSR